MLDNQGSTAGQAPAGDPAPQAGAAGQQQDQTQPTDQTTTGSQPAAEEELFDGEPFDAVRAKSLIAKLRAEAKSGHQAAKDKAALEAKLRELEDKEVDKATRAERRLAELEAEKASWEQERQTLLVGGEVNRLQAKLGLVDVEAVARLMDWTQLDFDDSGRPTNTEEVVRDLVKAKPYLAGARPQPHQPIGSGSGTTGGPAPRLTAEELEIAKMTGMTPERYAALKGVKTIEDWQATRRQS